jgi:hypothetical protein
MHPEKAARGADRIAQALDAASDQRGDFTFGDTLGSIRFGFADTVALQWLPDAGELAAIETLREALLALVRFTQRAVTAYQATRPEGTFEERP